MASDNPQTLQEFTTNLLTDLDSGVITPHEALVAMSQYAYLRDGLENEADLLAQAAFLSDEELDQAVRAVAAKLSTRIEELPSFQSQNPDKPTQEGVIRDKAFLHQTATERYRQSVFEKRKQHSQQHRTFVHDLVTKFSSTVPTLNDEKMSRYIDDSLLVSTRESDQDKAKEKFIQALVSEIESSEGTLTPTQKTILAQESTSVLSRNQEVLTEALETKRRDVSLYAELIKQPEIPRPDVYIDVALHAPPSENIAETVARASRLSHAAKALEEQKNLSTGKVQFFTTDNSAGVARGFQQAADNALSIASGPVRHSVIAQKLHGTMQSIMTNSQKLTDRVGAHFINSPLFGQISQNLSTQLSQRAGSQQARSVADDFFSTVFRSGNAFNPALSHGAEDRILDYFELMRANSVAPKNKQFLSPLSNPFIVFDALGKTTRSGILGVPSGSTIGYTRTPGFFIPFLSTFNPFGVLGGLAGNIFSSSVDRTTAFLFTNPRLSQQYSASRRAAALPTPLVDDMPKLVALVVVATILILFVLPTPFNLNQISHSAKIVSLFSSLKQKVQEFTGGEIICTGECKWPTAGTITQGPKTFASHKGGIEQSIDIGAPCGTPVVSTLSEATVVEIQNNCTDNTGRPGDKCGGGWGNYVILRGTIGGQQVTLRFAHLVQGSMLQLQGRTVQNGEKVGNVNNNGSSDGCHLHYEVVGNQPPINSILPYSVPSCVGRTMCCALLGDKCSISP